MMKILIPIITYITVAFIALLGSLISKAPILRLQKWVSVSFLLCISAYLVLQFVAPITLNFGCLALLFPTFALPYVFWIYTKVIFSDNVVLSYHYGLGLFGFVFIEFLFFFNYNDPTMFSETNRTIVEMLSRALSLFFVILGLWEVVRHKGTDLVTPRIQYREVLILATAFTIGLTLLTELFFLRKDIPDFLIVLQRTSILILIIYVLYQHIEFKNEFFQISSVSPHNLGNLTETHDLDLIVLIKNKMDTEIWREESLTIQKLAEALAVKEYRLRKTINTQLGYRNFNEFLNAYRIEEAKKLLTHKSKNELNIQELAFQLGYTSLSTFNKAFKENTDMTPTEWRKNRNQRLKTNEF
jgi:AraC-like DNA-binding protein